MGCSTLELARLVATRGRVVAVDMQEKMLSRLGRRLKRGEELAKNLLTFLAPGCLSSYHIVV